MIRIIMRSDTDAEIQFLLVDSMPDVPSDQQQDRATQKKLEAIVVPQDRSPSVLRQPKGELLLV